MKTITWKRLIKIFLTITLLIFHFCFTLSAKAASYSISVAKGNTNSVPSDCMNIYNGFNANSNYNTPVRYGWKIVNGKGVKDNANPFIPNHFQTASCRDILYYSGHGTSGGIINGNINVATATAYWDKTRNLKAFMTHACYQMDKSGGNALRYAQLMKRTNIQVCTGFHEQSSAGNHDKTANEILRLANAGNSIKYSWQHGIEATEGRAQFNKWGYLVYNASIQYYRFPGFPGNTYPLAPNANIILARKGLANFIFTNASLASSDDSNAMDIPLYISATLDANKGVQSESMRESDVNDYYTLTNDFQVDKAMIDISVKESLQKDSIDDMICVASPVILCSVDVEEEKYGEDKITEYVYTYYDTYNGVPISDSFIKKFIDQDGIYTTTIAQKNLLVQDFVENNGKSIISEVDALGMAIKSIDAINDKSDVNFSMKFYIPMDEDESVYKLMYVIELMDGSVYYVDAETAQVMDVQTLTVK